MKKLLMSIIFIMLITQAKGLIFQNTSIPGKQCVFFYQTQGSLFTFDNCSLSTTVIFSWKECLQKCCNLLSIVVQPPSEATLRVCTGGTNNSSQTTIIIVCIVTGVTFVVVLIGCLIRRYCLANEYINRVANQVEEEINSVEWIEENQLNSNVAEIKWSPNSNQSFKLQSNRNPCSICLQEEMKTAELYCKHQFHSECIGSWFKKNKVCPCCRLVVKGIKVYCSKCLLRYMVWKRNFLGTCFENLPRVCSKCTLEEKITIVLNTEQLINFEESLYPLEQKLQ